MSSVLESQSPQQIMKMPGKRHLYGEVTPKYMLGLGLTLACYQAVEAISGQMVPITLRKFTDNAFILAAIISLNGLFGFVAQPYVAWKSDHTNSRFGRRRPFLLFGYPATLLSVLAIMVLPMVITGDARYSVLALALVFIANVSLQCFQDVCGGAMEPLMGDTFKQEKLGRAVAVRNYFNMAATFSIGYGAMRVADKYEWAPYAVCAVWLTISILMMIFFVRERPIEVTASRERYNPIKHMGLLFTNADYLRVAIISSLGLVVPASFGLFNSLFVTQQLGMTREQLANTSVINPLITIACAFPIGYMIDRFGPKWMMSLGFLILAVVSLAMAYLVKSFWPLFICMNLNYLSGICIWGSMSSMVFQYASQKERGTVFGLVQFTRAAIRFASTFVLGFIVQYSVSYEITPFYADDFKKSVDLVAKLQAPKDPVSQYLRGRLSENTLMLLSQPVEGKKVAPKALQSLTEDMNKVIHGASIYDERVFKGVELSKQSKKLLAAPEKTNDDLVVLNRALIIDAYPQEISKKLNYRATYVANGILGLLALLLTLTSRPGKYARTLKDAKQDFD